MWVEMSSLLPLSHLHKPRNAPFLSPSSPSRTNAFSSGRNRRKGTRRKEMQTPIWSDFDFFRPVFLVVYVKGSPKNRLFQTALMNVNHWHFFRLLSIKNTFQFFTPPSATLGIWSGLTSHLSLSQLEAVAKERKGELEITITALEFLPQRGNRQWLRNNFKQWDDEKIVDI